jgi:hypothetical protein
VGEKKPPSDFDVIICMDARWNQIPPSIRDSVGLLILDEAHLLCTHTRVQCLLAFQPQYIVALSATLKRDDDQSRMIQAICGEHSITRESKKEFTVFKVKTGVVPERRLNKMGGVDWSYLVSSTLLNKDRNTIIINLVKLNLDRKILILTSLKGHSTLLADLLKLESIDSDYLIGTKNKYVDSPVLIGTISKIGTGFDPATACPEYQGQPFDLLILACSMKKHAALTQNIGRVFRCDSPIIYHLVDDDSILKKHWYEARQWYLSNGATIKNYTV